VAVKRVDAVSVVVNDGGSVTEVNDVHPWKTQPPIAVIDGGRVTEVNDVQYWKTL